MPGGLQSAAAQAIIDHLRGPAGVGLPAATVHAKRKWSAAASGHSGPDCQIKGGTCSVNSRHSWRFDLATNRILRLPCRRGHRLQILALQRPRSRRLAGRRLSAHGRRRPARPRRARWLAAYQRKTPRLRARARLAPPNTADYDSGIYIRAGHPAARQPFPERYQINLKQGGEGNLLGPKDATSTGLVKPGEWNHFKITVVGDRAELEINGQPAWKAAGLEDAEGYIGLQSEVPLGGQFEFRNIELTDLDYQPLFNGQDLSGWVGDTRGYAVEDGASFASRWADDCLLRASTATSHSASISR